MRIDSQITGGRAAAAYTLCTDSAESFDQISLESMGFGSGRTNGLYIYDRSMVMGPVPFWRVKFDDREGTFSVTDCRIIELEDKGSLKSMRFPIVLDGDCRLVLKMTTDCDVAVFNEETDKWLILNPDDDTDFDLSTISTRAITETFGRAWHRCGVIESPLSIFADEGHCVFKIYHNNIHTFYTFDMDKNNLTYCLRKCSRTQVEKRLQARFYMHCSSGQRVVFVNKDLISFVSIQPPTLREISFWAFQRSVAHQDENGLWHGGKSEMQLREICQLSKRVKLL